MTVEVAGHEAVERAGGEGQRHRVADDDARVGHPRRRDAHHLRALIDRDDLAAQVAGEEPCPAGDIEHAGGRQRREDSGEPDRLLVPARAVALREQPDAVPPVVVLARAAVVVGAHPLINDPHVHEARHPCATCS
jgi:hypothetical protein